MAKIHTILLADDEPDLRFVVTKRLEVSGYRVLAVADGPSACELAFSGEVIDCAILDIMMPGLNGFQVCRKLRADERTKHIPVIILTAKDEVTDRYWAEQVGADAYLTKPFDVTELTSKVRARLAE